MSEIHSVKLAQLVKDFSLEILHQSSDYEKIVVTTGDVMRPGLALTGYFDRFDATRLQVIGQMESAYLLSLSSEARERSIEDLFQYRIPAVIITCGIEPFPEIVALAREYQKTLLRTKYTTSAFLARLIAALDSYLAPRITQHGVLMEVYGEGVLLTGESGVGKSETAIELIRHGHRLIADDAVEMKRLSSEKLIGTAPEVIRHYMELRGVGIIDVCHLFGMSAVKQTQVIDLVVHLTPWEDYVIQDRMNGEISYVDILDVKVPCVTIPVKPGRNLSNLVEVAAMSNRHKEMGHDPVGEFSERLDRYFTENARDFAASKEEA